MNKRTLLLNYFYMYPFFQSDPDVFNKNITSPKYSEVFKIVLAPVKSTEEVILDNSGEY